MQRFFVVLVNVQLSIELLKKMLRDQRVSIPPMFYTYPVEYFTFVVKIVYFRNIIYLNISYSRKIIPLSFYSPESFSRLTIQTGTRVFVRSAGREYFYWDVISIPVLEEGYCIQANIFLNAITLNALRNALKAILMQFITDPVIKALFFAWIMDFSVITGSVRFYCSKIISHSLVTFLAKEKKRAFYS